MLMTLEQKKQHPIASQIPLNLWQLYHFVLPANWNPDFSQDTPIASLEREKLPKSPEQSLILLLIIYKDLPANELISYANNQLSMSYEKIFSLCALMEHVNSLKALAELSPDNLPTMIKSNGYYAFRYSCKNGHLDTAKWLGEQLPDERLAMIKWSNYYAFQLSCQNGHLDTAKWLGEQLPDERLAMIKSNNYYAFRLSGGNGHLDTAKWLAEQFPDERLAMIKAHGYYAFQLSCENGRLDTAKWLAEQLPDERLAMIKVNNYCAFRLSCENGHLDTAKWLAEQLPAERLAMIKADNYQAFRYSCVKGHLDTAKWLAEQLPDELSAMIKTYDYYAFRYSYERGHFKTSKWLLNDPGCLAYAEIHIPEYGVIVTPYIKSTIQSLQEQFRAYDDIRQPFNIDEQEALRAFYMLRHLIRLNAPEHHDDIVFLLSLPAVKVLAHQSIRDGQANELLRLAVRLNNQDAAGILLSLPEVRALAERDNYYRDEARGNIDLRAITQDRESSMRSLSHVEIKRLEKALARYKPMLNQAGVEEIIGELKAILTDRFHANPISVDGMVLPMDYQAFQDLHFNAEQTALALKAYYQHPDHTAYRYLSKPNHWMHEQAGYVYINEARTERWSTFEEYLLEIALHFLAAIDKTVPAIDGHTLEGRFSHFINELALIGRAHNWDKTRTNKDGKKEEYDDGEGDRPSCYSGVKRRLFQSVVGHPDFTMLSPQMIDDEIRFFVVNHYLPNMNDETFCRVFNDIYQHLSDKPEPLSDEHTQFLRDNNIPEAEINAFKAMLSARYGEDYEDAPQYQQLVNEAFALTPRFGQPVFHLIEFSLKAGLFNRLDARLITNGNVSSNHYALFPPVKSPDAPHSEQDNNLTP